VRQVRKALLHSTYLQVLLFAVQHAIVQAGKGYESTGTDRVINTAQRHAVGRLVKQQSCVISSIKLCTDSSRGHAARQSGAASGHSCATPAAVRSLSQGPGA